MSKRRPPPLLPKAQLLEAINNTGTSNRQRQHPLFEGHLHLWETREIIDKLDWATETAAAAVVRNDHGAARYMQSVQKLQKKGKVKCQGMAYIQIESRHAPGQWGNALREIEWLVSEQLPHVPIQAIIPWAPLDEGREAMQSYHSQLLSLLPSSHHKLIKGFRYLLQDFPSGTNFPMAQDKFIDSLKWMGENDLSFDCTIDTQAHGNKVLENVVDCITKVHRGQEPEKMTRFILDHLAKPDYGSALSSKPRSFLDDYEHHMSELAFMPSVSLKFSGYVHHLPQELVEQAFLHYTTTSNANAAKGKTAYSECVRALKAFLLPLLEGFGDHRIVWGGDWPVCKIPVVGPGKASAVSTDDPSVSDTPEDIQVQVLDFTYQLALDTLLGIGLNDQSLDRIFCENAKEFYRVAA